MCLFHKWTKWVKDEVFVVIENYGDYILKRKIKKRYCVKCGKYQKKNISDIY